MQTKVIRTSQLLASLLAFSSLALSQGEFLRKGESGAGASSGFSTITSSAEGANSVDFSVGVSLKSIVDLNLTYAKQHPPDATIIVPGVSYYISRQDKEVHETVALSLLFRHVSGAQALVTNSLGLGLSVAHNFLSEGNVILQPNFSFVIYPVHGPESETVNGAAAGLSVGTRFGGGHCVVATPSVGYQSGNVSVGASIAFVANFSPGQE